MGEPGFWDNQDAAKGIVAEAKVLKAMLDPIEQITAALDDHLNDRGFIVPGLGDAGDRWNASA